MLGKLKKVKHILFKKANAVQKGIFDCPVCRSTNVSMRPLSIHYFAEMQKHGFVHNVFHFETLHIEQFTCSVCGASDRDRLYALYLKKLFESDSLVHLLDIAPAASLRKFIKHHPNVVYRSMDLYMDDVDDQLDITNMNLYRDEKFDFFICSHVLEHIPNDIKAMQELFRVLKKGGKGIAMVPINLLNEKTSEDPDCNDVELRWKHFGQDDHIRMYAKNDFIQRLKTVGFNVNLLDQTYFGQDAFIRNAIFPSSVLYIVSK